MSRFANSSMSASHAINSFFVMVMASTFNRLARSSTNACGLFATISDTCAYSELAK